MMIAHNSLARQKEGVQGERGGGKGKRSKKGRLNRNSDVRRGRSHIHMRGTGERMVGGMGLHFTGRAEEARE